MLATAHSVKLLAAGDHSAGPDPDLFVALAHQPTVVSIIVCSAVMLAVFGLLSIFKINPLMRALLLIPVAILLAVVYMPHNPTVTTILLSTGFVSTFLMAFTLLKRSL